MKKKIRYIEETYTDKYKFLYQVIQIDVDYDKNSKSVRAMINPNLTILLKRRYLTDMYELVKEEIIGDVKNAIGQIIDFESKEILEKPKKIEKIEMYQDEEGHYFLNKQDRKVYVNCDEMDFMVDKFNELIDEINNLKEK